MKTNKKTTELGKSYWDDTGAYTKEYEKLYEELVPGMGEAETLNGELIRSISRLGYEYNNNGNFNAREIGVSTYEETCWSCNGDGSVTEYDEEEDTEEKYDCNDCGGCGTIEEEEYDPPVVSEFYRLFLEFIEENVPNTSEDCGNVSNIICMTDCSFSDEEENKYDRLFDKVMFHVLNSPNQPLK